MSFIAAMMWAKGRDPLQRIEFSLKTISGEEVKGIAVLPKPVAKHPLVIYVYGSGGSLLNSGKELRQIAELDVAAVGIEYNQTNQTIFDEQFIALQEYLKKQSWAQSNATAWVGFSLGAQRILSFALTHPEIQPQLMVRMAGGWVEELNDKFKIQNSKSEVKDSETIGDKKLSTSNIQHPTLNRANPLTPSLSPSDGERVPVRTGAGPRSSTLNSQPSTLMHCPVLLSHGERDEVFPVADCKRLAELLRFNGTSVAVRTLPQLPHNFGEDWAVVMRSVAEYCAAHLPLTDYAAALPGCRLTSTEAQRFNLTMRRAGQHRRELWRAVTSSREPERHTVMNVIGGLEDYDLAHISKAQLHEFAYRAWEARRKYPWCRDTPLEIFEKFTANPRIYEEALEQPPLPLVHQSMPRVKYCHDTAEASDAVGAWLYSRLRLRNATPAPESTLRELMKESGWCRESAMMYTYLGRSVGLPMRPAYTIWPTLGSWHWFSEVWSAEEKQWHAVDSANQDRTFNTSWVLRVPKSCVLSTTGERGGWNALAEKRWEAFTNTVGLFYPSGEVVVRVLDRRQPANTQRVVAQAWLSNDVFSVVAARTSDKGEAHLTLGQSAKHPYRLLIDGAGESDWQWLAVQSNGTYAVTLSMDKTKPFDKSTEPPPLDFSTEGKAE